MKYLVGLAIAACAALLSAAYAPAHKDAQQNFDLMRHISYTSVTEGTGRYRGDQTSHYTLKGTGVVVGDKYLTVDHVVSQYEKVTYFGMSTSRVPYVERRERTYLLDGDRRVPLQEIVNDRTLDIAVFRIPQQYCHGICNNMGAADLYSGRIPLGREVMFIGFPAEMGFYYRESRFAGMVRKGNEYNGRKIPVDAIAIYPSLITGDSGSGLFDKDTGRLMGINYYNIQTLGLVKPIALYEPYLDDMPRVASRTRRAPVM